MNHPNQVKSAQTPTRRGRGCFSWLIGIAAVLAILTLLAAVYQPVAEAADLRAFPPPGEMVDVGGYRLHINCAGTGSPTVVIAAGLGDWSTQWEFLKPEVSKTARVCTYDRAGTGWSEPGTLPRDAQQIAQELHTLLQNANIPGPYILVGHSLGGLPVVMFTHEYPSEVAGVVLVDSMAPGQSTAAATSLIPQTGSPTHASSPLSIVFRLGIIQPLVKLYGLATSIPEIEKLENALSMHTQNVQAYMDDAVGMDASMAQVKAVNSIGDLPLTVLSRGIDTTPELQAGQAALAELSSNSRHIIVENSNHNINVDQPQAVIAAILAMIELVRR